ASANAPSRERSGWAPEAGSTMARRSCTRITPASTNTPLQSGPRWRWRCESSSACRRKAARSSPGCKSNIPKIEHMVAGLCVVDVAVWNKALFESRPWMAGSALRGWIRALVDSSRPSMAGFAFARMDARKKNQTRQNDEGPLVAGLRRVSFVETFSYARARQRLALLFARLLLAAATKLRAAGAVAFGNWAVIEVMRRLNQMLRRNASDDFA